jgi:glucose-1-phosphate cytidylyltransferase
MIFFQDGSLTWVFPKPIDNSNPQEVFMKVAILCGGYGTRIRDVADNIPKPMIPVGTHPILWHLMKYYSWWGHNQFVLCLGYRGHVIKEYFLNYEMNTRDFTITLGGGSSAVLPHNDLSESGWKITMAETGLQSMTGARIRRIREYIEGEEDFLLTYGDGLADVDLDRLIAFHKSHGRVLTVCGVRPPGRFGELASDNSGVVTEFNEKPQAREGRISGGFFVCRSELFSYLPDRSDLVFEVEPMRQLVSEKQLMVYEHNGFWQPMDTYRDYSYLNGLMADGRAPWTLWEGSHARTI